MWSKKWFWAPPLGSSISIFLLDSPPPSSNVVRKRWFLPLLAHILWTTTSSRDPWWTSAWWSSISFFYFPFPLLLLSWVCKSVDREKKDELESGWVEVNGEWGGVLAIHLVVLSHELDMWPDLWGQRAPQVTPMCSACMNWQTILLLWSDDQPMHIILRLLLATTSSQRNNPTVLTDDPSLWVGFGFILFLFSNPNFRYIWCSWWLYGRKK